MMAVRVALALLLAIASGCYKSPVSPIRFANEAVVWQVNDRVHVKKEPRHYELVGYEYKLNQLVTRRAVRLLEVQPPLRALGTNALGEVPNSTWFTNRIGRFSLTPGQVGQGPNLRASAELHLPLLVFGYKIGGTAVGFLARDQRGHRYLIKFDRKGVPEMETGAAVVAQRILWSCGFNVPEDEIIYFKRHQLQIAPGAKAKTLLGVKRPLTQADLDLALREVNVEPDGRIRALASRLIEGKILGGYPQEGTRPDDPNDHIPHQRRRDIRGLRPIFAWLNQIDVKDGNTLDVLVKDAADPAVRYVKHYLIDFGQALGTLGYVGHRRQVGLWPVIDLKHFVPSLLAFGLWPFSWEGLDAPGIRGVGIYETAVYQPASWATSEEYFPFDDADRFDHFWGAKILIRFTREQLRQAVQAGRYSDPRARRFLLEMLVKRQRKTARYWFGQLTPIDAFRVQRKAGSTLCFEDLLQRYRLTERPGPRRYAGRVFDFAGERLATLAEVEVSQGGEACLALPSGASKDGYRIVQILARNGLKHELPVEVHLAAGEHGLRVIGVHRR